MNERHEYLLDLGKDELISEVLEIEERHKKIKDQRCIAVHCFGIYKDYDGNSGDSTIQLHVLTRKLAKQATNLLEEEDGNCVYSEGHEWAASWSSVETICLEKEIAMTYEEMENKVEALRDD